MGFGAACRSLLLGGPNIVSALICSIWEESIYFICSGFSSGLFNCAPAQSSFSVVSASLRTRFEQRRMGLGAACRSLLLGDLNIVSVLMRDSSSSDKGRSHQ